MDENREENGDKGEEENVSEYNFLHTTKWDEKLKTNETRRVIYEFGSQFYLLPKNEL